MDLDLGQVRAFVAVAEALHFGRAAASLYLTQQGVSHRVARLEKELGQPLLVRDGRTLTLTEAGQRFLPRARDLLATAHAAVSDGWPESSDSTGRGADRPHSHGYAVPAQTPPVSSHFVGRAEQLGQLDRLLDVSAPGPALAAIVGPGGVGKTTLAAVWAHRVRQRFPDGQLHVDLRGFHPRPPMPAADAAALMLVALGVPEAAVPFEADARFSLLRTSLTRKRILVTIDNAADSAHARPLIAGAEGCVVLVTSRDRLTGLVSRDGAVRVGLGPLPHDDAVTLIERVARISLDPAAVDLASVCGGLPLALRIAAQQAVDRPGWSVSRLARELAGRAKPLDLLSAGDDPLSSVRTVLDWSYQALEPKARHLLRLLTVHPGARSTAASVAALAELAHDDAERLLESLREKHLVNASDDGRYHLHDLVAAFACERAAEEVPGQELAQAQQRILDWYRSMIVSAALALDPVGHREDHWRSEAFGEDGYQEAWAWATSERATILAAMRQASQLGQDALVADLAVALCGVFGALKYAHDWAEACRLGIVAAKRIGAAGTHARLLSGLAHAHLELEQLETAAGYLAESLPLRDAVGDERGRGTTLNSLAIVLRRLGRPFEATGHLLQALQIHRRRHDIHNEAMVLTNLGNAYRDLARYDDAMTALRSALAAREQTGQHLKQCIVLVSLGETCHAAGDYEQALEFHQQAHDLAVELGDDWQAATALAELGYALAALGRHDAAQDAWRRALPPFESRRHPRADELARNLERRPSSSSVA